VPPDRVTVVLPTFNERENLSDIAGAITAHGYRLLIVDDSSPDGTGDIADRLAEENPSISVLHREKKEGLGPAYRAGFDRALADGAETIIEMDADFSHDPGDLPRLASGHSGPMRCGHFRMRRPRRPATDSRWRWRCGRIERA
jgi:dolichol-phosphate mannosyltransferase